MSSSSMSTMTMIERRRQQRNNKFDGYIAIQSYFYRVFDGDGKISGSTGVNSSSSSSSSSSTNNSSNSTAMKALLLDPTTTQIVSAVFSQTEILRQQIYYVTKLGASASSTSASTSSNTGSSSNHLRAIVVIRPTIENIDLLVQEIKHPTYYEYHIFFTGTIESSVLKKLATADINEKIIQIQEFYIDYIPIQNDFITFQIQRSSVPMSIVAGTSWAPQYAIQYERTILGIQSLLLSFQRRPYAIRYASASPCAEELAKDVYDSIIYNINTDTTMSSGHSNNTANNSNYSTLPYPQFPKQQQQSSNQTQNSNHHNTLLLVLDRRDDPITPLLSQWTYQAMVHELLGLNNHRVILKGAPNITKDLEEVVLNTIDDDFFLNNRNSNFGELGEAIQQLLKDYQQTTASHNVSNLSTIEDMQTFMEQFPELRSKGHTVSKHVAIMGELARLVDVCSLMDVSQFEQSLACNNTTTTNQNEHHRELMEKLSSTKIKIPDKLRLGLLFCLRYENSCNINAIQQSMMKGGVSSDMVQLIPALLRYGGYNHRSPGLFGENHHLMSKMTKSILTSVQGIQNVYAQHVPVLMDTIQSITKGKLSTKHYPILQVQQSQQSSYGNQNMNYNNNHHQQQQIDVSTIIPDEILIFMVGGVTYEESMKVTEFNLQQLNNSNKRNNNNTGGMTSTSTLSSSSVASSPIIPITTSNTMNSITGANLNLTSSSSTTPCIRVILAGSTVHNSTSFLDELKLTNTVMSKFEK